MHFILLNLVFLCRQHRVVVAGSVDGGHISPFSSPHPLSRITVI